MENKNYVTSIDYWHRIVTFGLLLMGIGASTNSALGQSNPGILSLHPSSIEARSGPFTLTVSGGNFVSNSVVRWNNSDRPTTYVSNFTLKASIPVSDIATAGYVAVTVFNPRTSISNSRTFVIVNPTPTTTGLSPSSKPVFFSEFQLTVNGTNFNPSSVVRFAGSSRATTYVSSTKLTIVVSENDLKTNYRPPSKEVPVTVFNPQPGGGESNTQNFKITTPVPVITSISPTSKMVGDAGFTLTVNGQFYTAAIRFAGVLRTTLGCTIGGAEGQISPTCYTQVSAGIPASDLTTAGEYSVTLQSYDLTSNAVMFSVKNPLPVLTSLEPLSIRSGGNSFTLIVRGLNFGSTSRVRWNGIDRTTTYISSTEVRASIPAADIADPRQRTATITVFNPTPGGGVSGEKTFNISPF